MTKLVVVTTNVLAEHHLQQQLQELNYEVLVSASLFEQLRYQLPMEEWLDHFQAIVLSERLTEDEVQQVLPALEAVNKPVIRRCYRLPAPVSTEKKPQMTVSYHWSGVSTSPVELKQMIEGLTMQQSDAGVETVNRKQRISVLQLVSFTPTELQLLQLLYEYQGQLVSKEVISQTLWQQEVTNSRKVQIYTLIGNLKEKLATINQELVLIGSQRANGYCLTQDFFNQFKLELPLRNRRREGGEVHDLHLAHPVAHDIHSCR